MVELGVVGWILPRVREINHCSCFKWLRCSWGGRGGDKVKFGWFGGYCIWSMEIT